MKYNFNYAKKLHKMRSKGENLTSEELLWLNNFCNEEKRSTISKLIDPASNVAKKVMFVIGGVAATILVPAFLLDSTPVVVVTLFILFSDLYFQAANFIYEHINVNSFRDRLYDEITVRGSLASIHLNEEKVKEKRKEEASDVMITYLTKEMKRLASSNEPNRVEKIKELYQFGLKYLELKRNAIKDLDEKTEQELRYNNIKNQVLLNLTLSGVQNQVNLYAGPTKARALVKNHAVNQK